MTAGSAHNDSSTRYSSTRNAARRNAARHVRLAGLAAFAASFTLATALAAGSAQALTIKNEDAKAQKLEVTEGKSAKPLTVPPQQTVTAGCNGGCTVKIVSNGDEYDFKGPEAISIQDNVIYTDVDPAGGE